MSTCCRPMTSMMSANLEILFAYSTAGMTPTYAKIGCPQHQPGMALNEQLLQAKEQAQIACGAGHPEACTCVRSTCGSPSCS